MPIFRVPLEAISKPPCAAAHCASESSTSGSFGNKAMAWPHTRAQPAQTRPRELQFNVIARSGLRSVRFHRCGPSVENVRRGDINQHRSDVGRLGFGRYRVIKQLLNRMRRQVAQFLDAAITGQPAGIAHQLSQPRMIGMLIFDQARREHDARPHAADDARQFDCVSRANFKMRIAVQFDEFNCCAQKRGGFFRLGHPLFRRAVGCRLRRASK